MKIMEINTQMLNSNPENRKKSKISRKELKANIKPTLGALKENNMVINKLIFL